ncbi:MAG: phospholipid carrier-dependent glycosyltransferase [Methylotenera sp.]|nr:phospholipid carrier-dependent glycosyltransferase [Methylotenera sp.]
MKLKSRLNLNTSSLLLALILFVILLRIISMISLPLTDTTEARYAELARVTATGHYWLMPHMSPEQPFFAKPPLSTWFSAASWLSFGQSEFALRLPSFILMMLTCAALLYGATSFKLSRQQWFFASFIIMTAPVGFITAGAVMTDATQLAVITWAMVFLWRIIIAEPSVGNKKVLKFDQLGFWAMLGLGAIAKGLATWVLIGLPVILFWLLIPKAAAFTQFKKIWSWLGVLLFLTIVLAWYVPAEIYYPGFLKYFIVGEHFHRFIDPGWQGDMYGTAHSVDIGMIWVYWAASIALWLPVFIEGVRKDRPLLNATLDIERKWLWAWVLAPLLFFTFSRNIIWTYTLTALPAFAILIAKSWPTLNVRFKKIMQGLVACWILLLVIVTLVWLPQLAEEKSARKLVREATLKYPKSTLYSYFSHKFSVSYYTQGQVRMIESQQMLNDLLAVPNNLVIISTELAKETERNGQGTILEINASSALLITQQKVK